MTYSEAGGTDSSTPASVIGNIYYPSLNNNSFIPCKRQSLLSLAPMFTIADLLTRLQRRPILLAALSFQQLLLFIDLCCQLRPLLELYDSKSGSSGPLSLSSTVTLFIIRCLSANGSEVDTGTIRAAWEALGSLIWELPDRRSPPELLSLFLRFGTALEIGMCLSYPRPCTLLIHFIGFITIRPPVLECPNRLCKTRGHRLSRPLHYHSTLFTLNNGPIPVYPVSLYCNGKCSAF